MPSDFVREQRAALVDAFGEPAAGDAFAVTRVVDRFTHKTAGDVRSHIALRAARQARARETWHLVAENSKSRFVVGVADAVDSEHPHSMVTVTLWPENDHPAVNRAWCLPTVVDLSPTEALLTIVEVAGAELTFGTLTARFIADAEQAEVGETPIATDGLDVRGESYIMRTATGWRASWTYAIDVDKYKAWMLLS